MATTLLLGFDPQGQAFILICAMLSLTLLTWIGAHARDRKIKALSVAATLPIGTIASIILRTFAMF